MAENPTAHAAMVDGEILVQTVGHSTTAAKVNGLLVLFNIMAREAWPDSYVDTVWGNCLSRLAQEQPARAVKIVRVAVSAVAHD